MSGSRFLAAEECELETDEAGNYRYTVFCGELDLGRVMAVRDYMGSLLVDLKVVPSGMSRLALQVVFRKETAAR